MNMKRIVLYAGLVVALFFALTVFENLTSGDPFVWFEFLFDLVEKAILASAVLMTVYMAQEAREARSERMNLIGDLAHARAEGDRWREAARVHIDGLGRAIRAQFDAWRLTSGEADVAILMLKGLSHKEIARLRNSSAATVRQQAAAVYTKSSLKSRSELAAYFLEDIFNGHSGNGNGELAGHEPAARVLAYEGAASSRF
jgi:DNA-binding CsgD family transcriptional regulator